MFRVAALLQSIPPKYVHLGIVQEVLPHRIHMYSVNNVSAEWSEFAELTLRRARLQRMSVKLTVQRCTND